MFKVTRVIWNGSDQPTANLYRVIKPTSGSPYWQLLYHKPERTIYLQGNVKIVKTERTISEGNQTGQINSKDNLPNIERTTLFEDLRNPYSFLRKKGGLL